MPSPTDPLAAAIAARSTLIEPLHRTSFRAFNGHLEGDARYVVDVYGTTAVVFRRSSPSVAGDSDSNEDAASAAMTARLRTELPWLQAIVVKDRDGTTDLDRTGRVVYQDPDGPGPATEVHEHGVRYALDLRMNQDASFYLDTRELRRWLIGHAEGATVLNTFAYTGSLGVAARAGGAARVVHTDLNRRFLNVAKRSYRLNGFAVERKDFQARDFWSFVRGQKLQGERYDLAILDPPFFSSTPGGTVDLERNFVRLVNKVRPLIRSGGRLVAVNNSLFVSGAAFMAELEEACRGGWMAIERTVDVPDDVAGTPSNRRNEPVVDPAPFDHSTKIAILNVHHRR